MSLSILLIGFVSCIWGFHYCRETPGTGGQLGHRMTVSLNGGCLTVIGFDCNLGPVSLAGWHAGRSHVILLLLLFPSISANGANAPLWIPLILFSIPTGFLWWLDRRRPAHCCGECGYDLTGNTTGICPECGSARGSPCKRGIRWRKMLLLGGTATLLLVYHATFRPDFLSSFLMRLRITRITGIMGTHAVWR